jgi:hypothetical protein
MLIGAQCKCSNRGVVIAHPCKVARGSSCSRDEQMSSRCVAIPFSRLGHSLRPQGDTDEENPILRGGVCPDDSSRIVLSAGTAQWIRATCNDVLCGQRGPGARGNLGGLAGADWHRQVLATAVGAGDHTWHAYLSTRAKNGEAAITRSRGIARGHDRASSS